GCGVLALLPDGGCAIVESTRILMFLAAESAGQCGPCINGLAALAEAMQRIASSTPEDGDIDRVWRWIEMVRGRGACHHPDGAVGQLASALKAFDHHLSTHLAGHRCYGATTAGFPPPPMRGSGWK
ncbi:MAG TPA: NADH-ubiquinone oxidoreductase-F iron-sulfur binding region domain-containing protein, partial [Candidatus Dormibacteraeota bacterium]|nr:NADH-ubiquinone oxidoreductase-F iron-sulfur binding region domain-containing protein [Candidatus Dormibacteraeota bacterium]